MEIIKLYADWCFPCKQMTSILSGVETKIPLREVNIDHNKDVALKYGVRSIPTMIIVDEDGNEIRRINGSHNRDSIIEFLGEYV